MSFLDRVRNWLAGPPHIDPGDDEESADLHEEYGTPDKGEEYLEETERRSHDTVLPSYAATEATETAEEEIEAEEAPPDPDP